jgi:Pectate lyase superfamily protein
MSSEGNFWGGNITAVDFLGALDEAMDLSALGIFNVKKYGALGNGMHNDLADINLVIDDLNAATYGGVLYFPAGNYKIEGAFTSPTKPCKILGSGVSVTTITQYTETDGFFAFSGITGVTIDGINFTYNTAATGGTAFTFTNVTNAFVSNISIGTPYVAIAVDGGNGLFFRGVQTSQVLAQSDCVHLTNNATEVHFTDCVFGTERGSEGVGIHMTACNAVFVTACDVMQFNKGCLIDPVGGTISDWVYNCYFQNTTFDNSDTYGLSAEVNGDAAQTYQMKFANCWFQGSGQVGVYLQPLAGTVTAFNFTNCSMNSNISDGVVVNTGVSHVQLLNCQIGNTASSTVPGDGIILTGTCSDILISGCDIGNTLTFPNTQAYGVVVGADTVTNVQVTGCDLSGNTEPAYVYTTLNASVRFSADVGLNPCSVNDPAFVNVPAPGSSGPYSYTNKSGVDLTCYLEGGTSVVIEIDGVNTNLTKGFFLLPVTSTLGLTYTATHPPTLLAVGN